MIYEIPNLQKNVQIEKEQREKDGQAVLLKQGKNGFFQKFKKNRFAILLFIIFAAGMIYGAILMRISSPNIIDSLGFITQKFIGKFHALGTSYH